MVTWIWLSLEIQSQVRNETVTKYWGITKSYMAYKYDCKVKYSQPSISPGMVCVMNKQQHLLIQKPLLKTKTWETVQYRALDVLPSLSKSFKPNEVGIIYISCIKKHAQACKVTKVQKRGRTGIWPESSDVKAHDLTRAPTQGMWSKGGKTHHLTTFEQQHLVWTLQDHVCCKPPLGNYTLCIFSTR